MTTQVPLTLLHLSSEVGSDDFTALAHDYKIHISSRNPCCDGAKHLFFYFFGSRPEAGSCTLLRSHLANKCQIIWIHGGPNCNSSGLGIRIDRFASRTTAL
ncbi:hypothetical protein C8R44DRAFT_354212 [Mycena epipterygia]|nr:hypothetical protein C8R44DRAFT_354212 [Mycena epipterygia]